MLSTNPASTAPMDSPALNRRSCKVNRVISAAAPSGRNRMIQGSAFIGSELQTGQILRVNRLALAIQRHNQCQPQRHLRRRDRNHEKNENLPAWLIVEARKSHQCQRPRVEHQFQGHVNNQQIAAQDNPEQPEREEQGADNQIVREPHAHLSSFLLSRTTPTMATSNSSETTSKGKT